MSTSEPVLTSSTSSNTISSRIVYINGRHRFQSNKVSTAKYTFVTFLPKFLFEQFRRYANLFFLFIALMQQIPNVSPTGRFTTAVPLVFILTVSAIKEIFEDIRRHRADASVNRSTATYLNKSTGKWEKKKWQEICVGEVIKVTNNQFFPADLLLISSSEPHGMCYIETANLDGETNLKIRQSLAATHECVTSEKVLNDLNMVSIECDVPNKFLYEFKGNLKINDRIHTINPDQILLRGAKLKNSNWVFGVVLYTGHETKLMMNSTRESPLKQSTMDKVTNSHIMSLFAILAVIAFISTIASLIWNHDNTHWYLGPYAGYTSNPFFTFLTFVILFNNLVPISLQVTLEVVRFFQAQFINSDLDMYHEESDTPAMARTSNLNEELGQVKYILSDKTGTLTRNIMEFKMASIAGDTFSASSDFHRLQQLAATDENVREFLTLIAVCHTVVPELTNRNNDELSSVPESSSSNSPPSPDTIKYQATSPDEAALVNGVAKLGFTFTTRTPQAVIINALGVEEKYEILNVNEFSSDRKRMSVIIRDANDRIKIYVKGADTVITSRIYEDSPSKEYIEKTIEDLEQFATLGLRTLCCAYAEFTPQRYRDWSKRYQAALSSDIKIREQLIEEITNEAESGLHLLGATAVEDKLQVGVPEAIDTLLKAGIKIWILTGDKKETAINIGFSCKLLGANSPLIVLSEDTLDDTRTAVNNLNITTSKTGLVIDGNVLRFALHSDIKFALMKAALRCKSVICCRVSPSQKAEIVEMVHSLTNQVTLAIGDGANDVAMIQKANVGVGISGQEGLQAAHSADYAISQFRFLVKLLLVHGAWSHSRLCKLILYSFYKNIALYVIELWFATVSGWSGQTIFERWTIGLYNVFFTAAPPLTFGLFDRQCSSDAMIKYPSLYSNHGDLFSTKLFWIWVWSAILHSLALFWLTYFMIQNDTLWSSGIADGGYLVFGNILYTYVIITVCLKAALETTTWTWFTHAAIWGSIGIWFVFLVIYSCFWPTLPMAADMAGMDEMIFSSASFWLGMFTIPLMTIIVDVTFKVINRTCFKTLADQVNDMEKRSVLTSPSQQTLLSETARLIRNVFDSTRRLKGTSSAASEEDSSRIAARLAHEPAVELQHGYAFSQEENGAVPQSTIIRVYDTTKAKPSGQ